MRQMYVWRYRKVSKIRMKRQFYECVFVYGIKQLSISHLKKFWEVTHQTDNLLLFSR